MESYIERWKREQAQKEKKIKRGRKTKAASLCGEENPEVNESGRKDEPGREETQKERI